MAAHCLKKSSRHEGENGQTVEPLLVDMASTLYMLNPGADLPSTQAAFETFFSSQSSWKVGHWNIWQSSKKTFASFAEL